MSIPLLYGLLVKASTKRIMTLHSLGFLVLGTCSQELSTGYPKCGILATDWAALRHSPSPLRAAECCCTVNLLWYSAADCCWCPEPESNRHALEREILSLLCLPISPSGPVYAAHSSLRAANVVGQPYWIRTSGLQLRRLLLYPTELRAAVLHCIYGGTSVSRTQHQRIMSPLL